MCVGGRPSLIATLQAAVHGLGGEVLVVRRLSRKGLPSTRFGGPEMTRLMIRVTWHITGDRLAHRRSHAALGRLDPRGRHRPGAGLVAAWASTGFGAIAQGPVVLAAIPVLAWWGVLG
jgi:hypothetical protein